MLFCAYYNVYISHTDAGGIVYHANHLNFLEFCRRDWFKSLGFDSYFLADGMHFVVKKAELDYQKALLLDDNLQVNIDKIQIKAASLIISQSIHRIITDHTTEVATKALITLACVRHNGQHIMPTRLPDELAHRLSNQSIVQQTS